MQISAKNLILVIFVVIGFLSTISAQMGQSELKLLSENADLIITGKVIQQNSNWNKDKTRIFTQATIQVEETLKGSGQTSIIVSYPGGEVGDIGEMYTHTPKFENEEQVLVFLKKDPNSTEYKVYNGEDGKLTVTEDEKTGEKLLNKQIKLSSFKSQIKSFVNE